MLSGEAESEEHVSVPERGDRRLMAYLKKFHLANWFLYIFGLCRAVLSVTLLLQSNPRHKDRLRCFELVGVLHDDDDILEDMILYNVQLVDDVFPRLPILGFAWNHGTMRHVPL